MNNNRSRRILDPLILASLCLFIFYVVWVKTRPEQVFWSLDEGGKFIHLMSILQTGKIDTPLVYPAESLDPAHEFVPLYYFFSRNEQIFSWWPINLALVSLPFYKIFGWIGLYLLPATAGAFCAYLAGVITRELSGSTRQGLAAICLTGLATPVTFYSTMFWEHTLSTVFCLASLWVLLRVFDKPAGLYGFLAGGLASLSIFFRVETLPIMAGFGLVLLLKRFKQAVGYASGTLLFSLPWLALNYVTAGNPLGSTFGLVTQVQAFSGLRQVGLKFVPFALFNPPRADAYIFSRPVLAVASLLLAIGLVSVWFQRTRWIALISFAGVSLVCAWVALQPSQYQAAHGIVLVAPHILFGLYLFNAKQLWKENSFPHFLLSALVLVAAVYIIQAWVAAGGLQWGPRYMLTIYPLLTIAGISGLSHIIKTQGRIFGKWVMATFICACLVGFIFEVRGMTTARKLMGFYARSIPVFAEVKDAPIVLTWEGFAMDVSPLYWQGNILSLSSDKPDWDAWNQHAHELGLSYYYTAKLLTVDNAPLDVIEERLRDNPSGVILEKIFVTP